jgi:oligopeptide/dipeptide ABC transporter ATP-binding protein
MTAPLLDVVRLSKRFPVGAPPPFWARFRDGAAAKRAMVHSVDDVSFQIMPGETLGLVGESGCGKSTLSRLVTRLIDPSDGDIVFAGKNIGGIPAHAFGRTPERAQIQMVFQDATDSLNPRFTAFDAIADPLQRLARLAGSALTARVERAAELCGLPKPLLTRFPHQLSGGQKARVGIARAIAVEPRLLLLDEPTAALDVSVQVVILRLLQDLKARLGISYLFVSHDLNVVRLMCDRVMVMYLGKIVESGLAHSVFAAPAHPYTRALVNAIPGRTQPGAAARLSGEPRSPIDPDPNVCRFYGRCPSGTDRCKTTMPALRAIGDGDRLVACHAAEAA